MTSTASPAGDVASGDYKTAPPKIRRVLLAIGLCGPAACVLVSLLGIVALFLVQAFDRIVLGGEGDVFSQSAWGILRGAMLGGFAATFNWIVAYLTIPAAWLALGLSLGRFPRRGILHATPYFRWGAILGAALVATPTLLGGMAFTDSDPAPGQVLLGATLVAIGIGSLAGLACAGLFIAIVRPARQLARIDASVF